MTINEAELRKLAELATPGEWAQKNKNIPYVWATNKEHGYQVHQMPIGEAAADFHPDTRATWLKDAAYIAAANPAAILALLDKIVTLTACVAKLELNLVAAKQKQIDAEDAAQTRDIEARTANRDLQAMIDALPVLPESRIVVDSDGYQWELHDEQALLVYGQGCVNAALAAPAPTGESLPVQGVAEGSAPDGWRKVLDDMREAGYTMTQYPELAHSIIDGLIDALDELEPTSELLAWAVERWNAEVSQRPLVNVHRRTLDDTWRQVIRFAGGDPDALIGPSHDALVSTAPTGASK